MTIKAGHIFGGFICLMICASLWAQQKTNAKKEDKNAERLAPAARTKKTFSPGVYLGREEFSGGGIKTAHFDTLLKQGISSHDSAGTRYRILGFDFVYAERKLYEDSAADLHIMTDYTTEYCFGDTISSDISSDIFDRIKPGDTVSFSHVILARAQATRSTDTFMGSNLRCVITK